MTRSLVIGLGSIGQRHARLLGEMGHDVAAVSAHAAPPGVAVHPSLSAALAERPDYVVIATATARHSDTLAELADQGFRGRVLVEKPLFADSAPLPAHRFASLHVAYQLRFHPVLQALKQHLAGEQVTTVQAHVGSYLPDWRPGRDYRRTASASRADGGGVLRDLSHELDYLVWLFGPARRLAALGGRVGELGIDCDDAWALLLELDGCPVASVQMNYLDRQVRREVLVTTGRHSFHADLVRGTIAVDGEVLALPAERDAPMIAQHHAVLAGGSASLCSAAEGLRVLDMIAAAEHAAATGQWVTP